MTSATTFAKNHRPRADHVELWLYKMRQAKNLSRAVRDTLDAIASDPEMAAFASSTEIAKVANVNVATITRTAQALDFKGWPALQGEIRARFLESLTVSEMASVQGGNTSGNFSQETLEKEIENLQVVARYLGPASIEDFARSFAKSESRMILGLGSQAGVCVSFAHNANIVGYSAQLLDDRIKILKAASEMNRKTCLIVISLWRTYKDTYNAVKEARNAGVTICVITDSASSPIAQFADFLLVVPTLSTSFYISLAPTLAVLQSVCTELAAIDPAHTKAALAKKEDNWTTFEMLLAPQ